jgi:RNA polymerase sigma-70 factor (ECF subfamily)
MNRETTDQAEGFFQREYHRLTGYVRSLLAQSGEQDAEDIVQEVMVSLFRRVELTGPVEDLAAYVYGSLRNRIIDVYRRRKENLSYDENEYSSSKDERFLPDEIFQHAELASEIQKAVDQLPPPLKSIFVMVEVEGLTHKQAAELLEIPLGTALTWNREARRRLRNQLKHLQ